jgi:hypothetical protein
MSKSLSPILIGTLLLGMIGHASGSEPEPETETETETQAPDQTLFLAAQLMTAYFKYPEVYIADAIANFNFLYMQRLVAIDINQLTTPGFKSALPSSEQFPFGQWAFEIYKGLAKNHRIYSFSPQLFSDKKDAEPIPEGGSDSSLHVLSWLIKAALLHHKEALEKLSQLDQAQLGTDQYAAKKLWQNLAHENKLPDLNAFVSWMQIISNTFVHETTAQTSADMSIVRNLVMITEGTQFIQKLSNVRNLDKVLYNQILIEKNLGVYLKTQLKDLDNLKTLLQDKYVMEHFRLMSNAEILNTIRTAAYGVTNQTCNLYYERDCKKINTGHE